MGYAITVVIWVITVVVAFVAGLLVYRNNAKQFKEIEETAKSKGKSIADVLKGI